MRRSSERSAGAFVRSVKLPSRVVLEKMTYRPWKHHGTTLGHIRSETKRTFGDLDVLVNNA